MTNPSHNHDHGASPNPGNSATSCPRLTSWCTEHEHDANQCISEPVDISPGCSVWLMQEIPGLEPVMVIDTSPAATDLSLGEAGHLAEAIGDLRALATGAAR